LFFREAVGLDGCVMAFEPQMPIFQILCANVALNQHLNVYTYPVAISKSTGLLKIHRVDYRSRINFGMLGVAEDGDCVVPGQALDQYSFPRLDLIKIDIEGFEPEAILGAAKTILQHQPLIYAEYHPTVHSQNLVQLIQSFEYDVFLHYAPAFNPDNFKKCSMDIFGAFNETNIFCAPKRRNLTPGLEKMEDWTF
jgi:FkbM family methyltransferase